MLKGHSSNLASHFHYVAALTRDRFKRRKDKTSAAGPEIFRLLLPDRGQAIQRAEPTIPILELNSGISDMFLFL